jgi:hypothetical protein
MKKERKMQSLIYNENKLSKYKREDFCVVVVVVVLGND